MPLLASGSLWYLGECLSVLVISSLTMHRRGIFPLVIMFIGAENMFSLVGVANRENFLFLIAF